MSDATRVPEIRTRRSRNQIVLVLVVVAVLEAQWDQWDRVWCVRFVPPASSAAGLFAVMPTIQD